MERWNYMDFEEQFYSYMKADEVECLTQTLADQINKDYGVKDRLLLVGMLKGSFIVMADLIRKLHSDVRVDFVRTKSYGRTLTKPGTVALLKDISSDLHDTHVLIVEEVTDSGRALKFLFDRIDSAQPKSLKVLVLLDKRSSSTTDVPVHYVGKVVDAPFLVGYGMDLEEKFRNLPELYALKYPQ